MYLPADDEIPSRPLTETGELETASDSKKSFHSAQEPSHRALTVYEDEFKKITGHPRPDDAASEGAQRRSDFQTPEQARTPEQHAACERAILTVRQSKQAADALKASEGARTQVQRSPLVRGRGNIGTWVPDPLPSEDESDFDHEGELADRIDDRVVPFDRPSTRQEAFGEDRGSEGVPASEIEAAPIVETTTDAGVLLALRILPLSDHDKDLFFEGVRFGLEIAARAATPPLTGLATSPAPSASHIGAADGPEAAPTALPGPSALSTSSSAPENDSSDTRRTFGEDRDSGSITRGLYGSVDSDSGSDGNPSNALPLRGSAHTESAWRAEAGDTSGPAHIPESVVHAVSTADGASALAGHQGPATRLSDADTSTTRAGALNPSPASNTLSLRTTAASSLHRASTMASPNYSNANPSISGVMAADSSPVSSPHVNTHAGWSDHQPNTSGSLHATAANRSTGVARRMISSAGPTAISVRDISTVPNAPASTVSLGAVRDDAEVGIASAAPAVPSSSTQTGPSNRQASSLACSLASSAATQPGESTQASAEAIAPNPTNNVPLWSITYPRADRRPLWQSDRELQRHIPSTRAIFGNVAYAPQHGAGFNTSGGMRAPERYLNAENNPCQPRNSSQFNTNTLPDPFGQRPNPRNNSNYVSLPSYTARPQDNRASNLQGNLRTPSPYPTTPRTAPRGAFVRNTYVSPYLR